jgi:hypothetical protein
MRSGDISWFNEHEMSPLRIFPLRFAALQKAPVDKTVRYCYLNVDRNVNIILSINRIHTFIQSYHFTYESQCRMNNILYGDRQPGTIIFAFDLTENIRPLY